LQAVYDLSLQLKSYERGKEVNALLERAYRYVTGSRFVAMVDVYEYCEKRWSKVQQSV
jgi:hypothetical protein